MDRRYEALLRRLTVLDERVVEATIPDHRGATAEMVSSTSGRRHSSAWPVSSHCSRHRRPTSGWSPRRSPQAPAKEEVVGVLDALVPVIGVTRVSNAAVNVAAAIDCHLDLELLD